MKWGIEMKNNKGYSLVEILIVICILAVVSSSATISFRLIYNSKVTTGARTLQTLCKTARLNNMTKEKLKYIHIFKKDGANYVYVDEQLNGNTTNKEEQIGSAQMSISYGTSGGTFKAITNDKVLTIYFDRSGQCYMYDKSGVGINNVDTLGFTNGARTAIVNISRITGKVSME